MIHPPGYYETMSDEALHNEVTSRGLNPEEFQTRQDAIAHLQLDDEASESVPTPPLPAPVASNIPFEGHPSAPKVAAHEVPPQDADFTDGVYKMRAFVSRVDSEGNEKREATLHPGELFALCIHPANTYGRTHSLKNSLHYWEGTIGQFEAFFEKA